MVHDQRLQVLLLLLVLLKLLLMLVHCVLLLVVLQIVIVVVLVLTVVVVLNVFDFDILLARTHHVIERVRRRNRTVRSVVVHGNQTAIVVDRFDCSRSCLLLRHWEEFVQWRVELVGG